eukprot:1053863-Pyramimonas_sp.AAC.1
MAYQFEEDPEPLFEVQEDDPRREAPLEDEHEFERLEYRGPAAEQCPRPLHYAALAFLHLFSGARRPGDVQDELELNGDLTRSDIVDKWDMLLGTGRAIGLIGGPPCETWSAARWQELRVADRYRPPAPLRTLKHRWGRPG